MRRLGTVVLLAVLCCVAAGNGPAAAAPCTSQISGPSDPEYAPSEREPGSGTFNVEQWYLYDCIPQSAPSASDPEGAAGMSVNKAWDAFGRGNPKVLVAYVEGGINWRRDSARDLRRKVHLNTGELPPPQGSATHDKDGDGVVTADDYKDDPRIKKPLLHEATAGGITPEDLIVAFSDGTDADRNGYVDDISGWNFHRDTNDPQTDQSIYNHANAEMAVLAGEADNGHGGAGMCPNCRLLPIKAGDEAIDRPDRVAESIAFAVDSGAKVIALVVASLGQSPSMRAAVEYAHSKGVVIAWASNDFESSDHTEGMRLAHVWPGNGVVSDQSNRLGQSLPNDVLATTFRSRSSVTSYGSHALFSVASENGSTSQSVPITAGVAALVHSAGLDAGRPLSADEVFQVVRATVSPIDTTPCPGCFPAAPGTSFNIQYGYGRPNLFRAMEAVRKGEIPPRADFVTPDWYRQYDPERTRSVALRFAVAAPRSSSYTWELQYGLGPQPKDGEWQTIASGSGRKRATLTRTLDLTKIPRDFFAGAFEAPTADRLSIERYTVTLRLRVRDAQDRLGEERRAVYVRHDPAEVAAVAQDLGTSLESGPTLADIEGRGVLDVLVAGSDGTVHAIRPDGRPAPGWPVRTFAARGLDPRYSPNYRKAASWRSKRIPLPREPIAAPLAVGDLDRDGGLEVVALGLDGTLYAWDGRGRRVPGFPVQTDRRYARQVIPVPDTPYVRNAATGAFGAPVLGDLTGDGKLEVVVAAWDRHVYAWDHRGKTVPGWPAKVEIPASAQKPAGTSTYARDDKLATTPVLVDVDGDGRRDVIVALQDTAFGSVEKIPVRGFVTGFKSDGTPLPNMPLIVPAAAQGYGTAQDFITEGVQSPVAYGTEDGPKLIANAGLYFSQTYDLRTGAQREHAPGTLGAESERNPSTPLLLFTTSPSVGRIGGRDQLLAAQAGSGATDVATGVVATPGLGVRVRSAIQAWNPSSGENLAAFTQPIQGLAFLTAPAIADVSGDGKNDLVLGTDSQALHGYDGVTGAPLEGWPKWTGGWSLWTPAVGDLGGDGKVEVAIATREGYLRVYRTAGRTDAPADAWHWHLNDWNTGFHGDDTRPPAAASRVRVRGRTLSFRAPGDDWHAGTGARYEVVRSRGKVRQGAKLVRVPVKVDPVEGGKRVEVTLPKVRGRWRYGVRAVDDAGNVGPLRVREVRR
jgi:hypothetical protein